MALRWWVQQPAPRAHGQGQDAARQWKEAGHAASTPWLSPPPGSTPFQGVSRHYEEDRQSSQLDGAPDRSHPSPLGAPHDARGSGGGEGGGVDEADEIRGKEAATASHASQTGTSEDGGRATAAAAAAAAKHDAKRQPEDTGEEDPREARPQPTPAGSDEEAVLEDEGRGHARDVDRDLGGQPGGVDAADEDARGQQGQEHEEEQVDAEVAVAAAGSAEASATANAGENQGEAFRRREVGESAAVTEGGEVAARPPDHAGSGGVEDVQRKEVGDGPALPDVSCRSRGDGLVLQAGSRCC